MRLYIVLIGSTDLKRFFGHQLYQCKKFVPHLTSVEMGDKFFTLIYLMTKNTF